ncbi:type II toxin-antitoxin system ParD family antitoxin (plasmid) [Skermanella mucosa]|nr:type II toxin-antitoxin system ParD family antitoxin [Skermanella mucosa]UEM25284.1 type II toxin-antitoxin system ParD family antitoxin [Skermanella mucosa]
MSGRNVSLTPRLDRFVDSQVETGLHRNASEVVREALRR